MQDLFWWLVLLALCCFTLVCDCLVDCVNGTEAVETVDGIGGVIIGSEGVG
jgi:hypothetical protein